MKWHSELKSLSCNLFRSQHSLVLQHSQVCICFYLNFLSISLHKLKTMYPLCEMPADLTSGCSHLYYIIFSHTFLWPLTLLLASILFRVPSLHFSLRFDCCCVPWMVNNSYVLCFFGRRDFLAWGDPRRSFLNNQWTDTTPSRSLPWL